MHHLVGHHHDNSHCEANGNDRHIHDSTYDRASCFICQFNISPLEESEVIATLNPPVYSKITSNFFYTPTHERIILDLPNSRGPPTFS